MMSEPVEFKYNGRPLYVWPAHVQAVKPSAQAPEAQTDVILDSGTTFSVNENVDAVLAKLTRGRRA